MDKLIQIEALKAIFNSSSDGIVILDSNFNIININLKAKGIFKTNKQKILDEITDILNNNTEGNLTNHHLKINEMDLIIDVFKCNAQHNNDIAIIILLKEDKKNILEKIKKLETDKKIFEQVFENSADGLGCMDSKGKVLKLNKAYEQFLGLNKEDFLGKSANLIVEKGYIPKIVTPLVLKDKKKLTISVKAKNKEILITGLPVFDKEGNLIRVIANIRDMTGLKQLQEKINRYIKLNEKHRSELAYLRYKEANITVIAKSAKMQEALKQAIKSAQVDSNVLITGESGTGKEVIAKVIYRESPRSNESFIAINCAAIPENLLESELFGYERGAFTGANHSKKGLLEFAQEGTLFLDEISSLPLNLQAKLLRIIQEKEFMRLGGKKNIKVNFKLIVATNNDLYDMVNEGTFRKDLYYRLNVINIRVPPLRERKDDIKAFVEYFTSYFNKKHNSNLTISPKTLEKMQDYDWPGNVRELENMIERIVVLGEKIFLEDQTNKKNIIKTIDLLNGDISLPQFISQTEKKIILQAYRQEGSTRKTAKLLGINQSTVVRKLHKYRSSLEASK